MRRGNQSHWRNLKTSTSNKVNYSIRFTPEAEETYEAIVSQLRQRWGSGFVKKFEIRLTKSLQTITTTPYLYPIVNEVTQVRRCLLHKNCSLFYKIIEDKIFVISFWDNRQDQLFN